MSRIPITKPGICQSRLTATRLPPASQALTGKPAARHPPTSPAHQPPRAQPTLYSSQSEDSKVCVQ
ncbi:hypothetical protein DSO57_1025557 [Entomophthora muscae]|uniref:Uncharacterized protein n=1 Tax=Entomophthora muscae TaxID=34485 RepID=A0ACC2S481_9FUNG|nr:hypothetical protein DSO57_1025557 [Entomophthora muscae]